MPVDRGSGTVGDAGDAPVVQVENSERFEDIIELPRGECNGDVLLITNRSQMLEVADSVLVKNNPLYRKFIEALRGGRGLRRPGGLWRSVLTVHSRNWQKRKNDKSSPELRHGKSPDYQS